MSIQYQMNNINYSKPTTEDDAADLIVDLLISGAIILAIISI